MHELIITDTTEEDIRLAEFYDNYDFSEDLEEAAKHGEILYLKAGENPIEKMRELLPKREARLKREKAEAARAARTKSAAATKSRRRQVVAAAV